MPQENRDKERLYKPGRLSVWFAVASAALVASLLWMIWADHFARPWKGIQADFFRRQAGLLEVDRQRKEATLLGVGARTDEEREKRTRVEELEKAVADEDRALEAKREERERLERELAEAKTLVAEADRDIKQTKGDYAEYRYNWQEAGLRKADAEQKRWEARLEAVGSKQDEREKERMEHLARQKALEARLDAMLARKKAAVAALEAARREYAGVTRQLDDAVGKTERNAWRNLPLLDIVSPSIRIEKVVLENIHDDYVFATSPKVDMCMTCHRGIDQEVVTEATVRDLFADWIRLKIGEKAWAAAKFDDVVPPYEKDRQGIDRRDWSKATGAWRPGEFKALIASGRAEMTHFAPADAWAKAVGIEDERWKSLSEDARRTALAEGFRRVFGREDPLGPFRVKPVEWAHPHLDAMVGSKSPHPMSKIGCTVCHAGVGPSTDFARAAHVPPVSPIAAEREAEAVRGDIAALEKRLAVLEAEKAAESEKEPVRAEREAKERRLHVLETEHRWAKEHGWKEPEYVDFPMLPTKHVEGQCLKCHLPSLHTPPKAEPLVQWEWKYVPGREGEAGAWQQVRALAPTPVAGPPSAVDGRWHAETLEHGLDTVREYGCTGCHAISNLFVTPGLPRATGPEPGRDFSTPAPGTLTKQGFRKVGPDLTYIGDKTEEGFVYRWVMNPNAYRIDTRMPSFYMRREHDDRYEVVTGPDGKPVDAWIVPDPDDRDKARMEIEALSITKYLFAAVKGSRRDTYPEVPQGDPHRGAKVFYTVGCYGCHVGRGVWDEEAAAYTGDAAARKVAPDRLLPGPRLTAMGSKTNAKWLNAWLAEPRHYWSMSNMGNMRWKDVEEDVGGKTVVRPAAQVRADVVAYLLEGRDGDFERMPTAEQHWTAEHERALNDYWKEWYGAGQADSPLPNPESAKKVEDFLAGRKLEDRLKEVGRKLVGQRGCFGCHAVAGYEDATQIGKDLSTEGRQDIHKFDFGLLGHKEVPETRWDWIDTKIKDPRVWDKGTFKPKWQDKLRMPKFNFTAKDREAVVTVILGLVRDAKDPTKSDVEVKELALYKPSPAAKEIEAGRAVVARYRCDQCHSIEGRAGYVTLDQGARGLDAWMLPPALHGEGNRVKSEWLFRFLKDPDDPIAAPDGFVRPRVLQRMPKFRMSDEEVNALVDYFKRLAGRSERMTTDLDDAPLADTPYAQPVAMTVDAFDATGKKTKKEFTVRSLRDETRALFDALACNRCHLPKGTPGADPNEGASAPPFTLAERRLRREWVRDMIEAPLRQIPNTKMPSFWPTKARRQSKPGDTRKMDFPEFLTGARGHPSPTPDDVSAAQMDALTRYVMHHYEAPKFPPSLPPEGTSPAEGGR